VHGKPSWREQALEVLRVGNNKLTSLPDTLGALLRLTELEARPIPAGCAPCASAEAAQSAVSWGSARLQSDVRLRGPAAQAQRNAIGQMPSLSRLASLKRSLPTPPGGLTRLFGNVHACTRRRRSPRARLTGVEV
jgi:hypothetical protein